MALIPPAIGPAADAKEFHDRVVTGWQTQADSSSHAGPSWLIDRAAAGFTGKWNINVLLRVNAQDPSTGDAAWFVSCGGFKWLGGGSAFLVGSVQSLGTGADAALAACVVTLSAKASGFGVALQGNGSILQWLVDFDVTMRKVATS
jgi:hypothetical protein